MSQLPLMFDKNTQSDEEFIIYEQPLNERIRNFLRIEYLFCIFDYYSSQTSLWSSRIAISRLLEATDLVSRSDIKNDLIKELDRYLSAMQSLKDHSNIDRQKLDDLLGKIYTQLEILRDGNYQPGKRLEQDELFNSVKQRIIIPGGTCSFDLPALHYWLNKTIKSRQDDLLKWKKDFLIIQDALLTALFILRNSSAPVTENAESGFYQKIIESGEHYRLIRIMLRRDCGFFPEISGGKHRFAVRFMEQPATTSRPVQIKTNVQFELCCCS